MSIPPSKRSHEDGGNGRGSFNHMSISKYPHVDSAALPSSGSKLTPSGSTGYHTPSEVSQESRMLKISRTESRDLDRKSPLVPIFRTSSSSNDVRSDRPSMDSMVDFRDSWNNNNRDFKVETKIESNRKADGKVEDNKETNPQKLDKVGSGLVSCQLSWKESKEHTEEKDHNEFHGIIGRNKIDIKGDDKERSDKDVLKEGRDAERWNRERKDKEKPKDGVGISGSLTERDGVVSENLKDRKEREEEVDKESDEGGTGREKDGIHHHKKMLRPRTAGMSEVSTVIYRVGECMEDLMKLWEDFQSSQADRVSGSFENGPTLEIRVPAEHVSAANRQVRSGQLWGTDVYTNDSDLVAVLMHTGYLKPTASPPSTIKELRATIRVLPSQDCYISTLRNNVRSRAWGAGIGCSYRVERCLIRKEDGGTIDLKPCLAQSSALEPTLAPVSVERTMTTRAAASNALRQQRFVREVTIQFSLSNEPWLKYSISVVADKGLKKPLFTSSRLKKGEVLYLESHSNRYELCFHEEKAAKTSQAHEAECANSQNLNLHSSTSELKGVDGENAVMFIDVFRFSRCKKFFTESRMRSLGIPLPLEHVEVMEDNLEWEDIQWSQTGVVIAGKQYNLARAHFLKPK